MRIAIIPLALLLAAPALAGAQVRSRPAPSGSTRPEPAEPTPDSAAMAPTPRPPRPPPPADLAPARPPPPGTGRPPPPGPGGGPIGWAPPPVYYSPPFWYGYGWGWGYYPLYPAVVPAPGLPSELPTQGTAATVRASGGFGPRDTGLAGLAFAVEGERAGFNLGFDAFSPSRGGLFDGGRSGASRSYGLGSAHFTYPLFRGPAFGVLLEGGGSWLSVPSSSFTGSTDAIGLDLGTSAHLGLLGPLGLEGHARITPYPVRVVDLRAAAALRGGALSLTFGYRVIDVEADDRTGPAARFEGPELGLGLIF
jgi:hypothetical protein